MLCRVSLVFADIRGCVEPPNITYMEDRTGLHIRSNAHWHTQGVCTAQCCAMFLCYLEDNLVGKCTCTHMMGLNTTTAHGLCSVHIRSIHIGVHIRSSAHLHTWRGAHISSHSMSPTSAMRSRLGSSATRVERHSPKIWLLHLSPSQYSESYHTYLFFWIATLQLCYDVLACLHNHRFENRHI